MDVLDRLRKEIDKIDNQLLTLIYKRELLVKRIQDVKQKLGLPTKDSNREQKVIRRLMEKGSKLGLSQELIQKLWKGLFKIAYKMR